VVVVGVDERAVDVEYGDGHAPVLLPAGRVCKPCLSGSSRDMGADRETDNDPERLADELEREAEDMEQRTEGLEDKVIEVRREWDRKRSDPSVPGAVPEDREAPPEKAEGESPAPEAPPENAETKTPPTDSTETIAPPTDAP
jgi:hypothetical protein